MRENRRVRSCAVGAATKAIAVLSVLVVLAACGAPHYQNTKLDAGVANPERRTIVPDSPDRPVILMAFSGGGTRAAALSESVLRDLQATAYVALDGTRHVFTDDVRLVSSVSGGSVTAAWFGLRGADGLDELRSQFLAVDNMRKLERDAADPVTWFRLAFGSYTTIRAQEALFDSALFHDATMAALNQPDRPFILPNTSDMASGETFVFSPQRFDDICSNFDALKISTAVAASAAVPIVLSPVDFRNNAGGCQGTTRPDIWAKVALSNPYSQYLNLPNYRDARYTNDLRQGPFPFHTIDYLHFLDGGLADNLGVKTLRSAMVSPNDAVGGLAAINRGQIRRLVVILVNARSDPPTGLYQQASTPGLIDAVNTIASAPINANTANSQLALQGLLTELAQAADGAKALHGGFAGMKIYGITVDYDQLPADTPDHRALRDAAKDVPTSWTLTPAQLAVTEEVGRFLLERHPCFAQLVSDLHATPPSGPPQPMPPVGCTTVER